MGQGSVGGLWGSAVRAEAPGDRCGLQHCRDRGTEETSPRGAWASVGQRRGELRGN